MVHTEDNCRHVFITKDQCCTDHLKEKATETICNFPSRHGVTIFGFGPKILWVAINTGNPDHHSMFGSLINLVIYLWYHNISIFTVRICYTNNLLWISRMKQEQENQWCLTFSQYSWHTKKYDHSFHSFLYFVYAIHAQIRFGGTCKSEKSLKSNTRIWIQILRVSELRYPYVVYNFSTHWNNPAHRQVHSKPLSHVYLRYTCANIISICANSFKWRWYM